MRPASGDNNLCRIIVEFGAGAKAGKSDDRERASRAVTGAGKRWAPDWLTARSRSYSAGFGKGEGVEALALGATGRRGSPTTPEIHCERRAQEEKPTAAVAYCGCYLLLI